MAKPIEAQYKEFCQRVDVWNESKVPFGLGDLKELALELGTPIPHFDKNLNLVFDEMEKDND